ncbi:MAG TPA: hypothetical protein VF223_12995 [Trebonia sp.]
MPANKVLVVKVDPLARPSGLLVPEVARRILETAENHFEDLDPNLYTAQVMARLWAGDETVLVLALVEDGTYKVVGHAVAEVAQHGKHKWVFVSQTKADQNVGDAIKRAILLADEWGKQHGCTRMVMATTRPDTAWKRKYGFDTMRHLMVRKLGSAVAEEGSEG